MSCEQRKICNLSLNFNLVIVSVANFKVSVSVITSPWETNFSLIAAALVPWQVLKFQNAEAVH